MAAPGHAGHQQQPYSVSLDPEQAKELAVQGASLLVLGMPPGTYFGIDQYGFTVGPKFKGVKMLPPGPHFITYRAVSAQGEVSPSSGFFLFAKPRSVVVKRWDSGTESLEDLPDADEMERYAAGVRRFDFDEGLAPYNLHAARAWAALSRWITQEHIQQLSPVSGYISIMSEATDPDLLSPSTEAEHKLVAQLEKGRAYMQARMQQHHQHQHQQQAGSSGPAQAAAGVQAHGQGGQAGSGDVDMADSNQAQAQAPSSASTQPQQQPASSQPGEAQQPAPNAAPAATSSGRCFYTRLPRLIKQKGATAAELTALNLDKSTLLQQVLDKHYKGQLEGLLGELQYAFIAFVYGQSLDSYAQWKALLVLLLGCEDAALHAHQQGFAKVITTVRQQLESTVLPASKSDRMGQGQGQAPGSGPAGAQWEPFLSEGTAGEASPFGVSMVEELLPDSFLKRMFGAFFAMLQESSEEVGPELFHEARQLKELLRRTLGWEYDVEVHGEGGPLGAGWDEEDEDGPVVVEDPTAFVSI